MEEYTKTLNILYIEDDKAFISKIKLILEKKFKSIFVASNGEVYGNEKYYKNGICQCGTET
ncbi:MAG: hypothetical protein RBR70_00995 [Arcobacter sp.]|uniref:hypothetical protein n=1 Tax=Arcobacter sp. TaxID=1872629 RepID=UPI002A75CBA4|nr:hypothetical protein [Arcobacter sp.]MDY3203633.1 hypothetical protein [Arcobacter sp.]